MILTSREVFITDLFYTVGDLQAMEFAVIVVSLSSWHLMHFCLSLIPPWSEISLRNPLPYFAPFALVLVADPHVVVGDDLWVRVVYSRPCQIEHLLVLLQLEVEVVDPEFCRAPGHAAQVLQGFVVRYTLAHARQCRIIRRGVFDLLELLSCFYEFAFDIYLEVDLEADHLVGHGKFVPWGQAPQVPPQGCRDRGVNPRLLQRGCLPFLVEERRQSRQALVGFFHGVPHVVDQHPQSKRGSKLPQDPWESQDPVSLAEEQVDDPAVLHVGELGSHISCRCCASPNNLPHGGILR